MSHYLVVRPTVVRPRNSSAGLGALGFDIEELATSITSRVINGVTTKVTSDLSKVIDKGVERVATSAAAGFDRFIDSPAGVALQDKVEAKATEVASRVVQKHQVNLALLGLAGAALVMGSVNVGSKLSPRAAQLSFLVAGVAAALAASGVFSKEPPVTPPSKISPRR